MTEKKTDAWMPLWIGAYLADTMHLTTLQHGAYFLLLVAYWRERTALPDDEDQLRGITKLERLEWKKNRAVLAKFFKVGGGVWWHKRVEKEIAAADARSKKASAKASAAAQARWQASPEHAASNAPSMPGALLEDMHEECPTPSPVEQEISEPSVPPAPKPSALCPHDAIVAIYHEVLPELPSVRLMGDARKRAIKTFWVWVFESKKSDGTPRAATAEQALAWIRDYFDRARQNDWLMGRSAKGSGHEKWECDLDFLMTEKGKKHVIEKTREAA